jgi:hypothetical protein
MQPHILTIPDDSVYEQLVQLAAAAGLHIADNGLVSKQVQNTTTLPDISKLTREEMLAIMDKGGDGKSIPDPLAWQREERGNIMDTSRPVLSEAERQHHLAIVARGGSGASIADPVAWQREIRQDRLLPGRD